MTSPNQARALVSGFFPKDSQLVEHAAHLEAIEHRVAVRIDAPKHGEAMVINRRWLPAKDWLRTFVDDAPRGPADRDGVDDDALLVP